MYNTVGIGDCEINGTVSTASKLINRLLKIRKKKFNLKLITKVFEVVMLIYFTYYQVQGFVFLK